MKKKILAIIVILLAILGAGRYVATRSGLATGQRYVDVPLVNLDGGATSLSAFKKAGRPLVVIVGSYT